MKPAFPLAGSSSINTHHQQQRLIRHLRDHGIRDERVLAVMKDVLRRRFVPPENRAAACEDRALPIAAGQTISQPYMVALMTQELALSGTEIVLEIGTGSGYQAAILSKLCRHVVTIERIPELSLAAKEILAELSCINVECLIGDGSLGCVRTGALRPNRRHGRSAKSPPATLRTDDGRRAAGDSDRRTAPTDVAARDPHVDRNHYHGCLSVQLRSSDRLRRLAGIVQFDPASRKAQA